MTIKNRKKNYSLKYLNTFSINVTAKKIIKIFTEKQLFQLLKKMYKEKSFLFLVLGQGSNTLFLENYKGIILLIRIKGIKITENNISWNLHVNAGEKWNHLVKYCLYKNIKGFENLSMIPGYVGSAIIQNIGAYGMQLDQACQYVDIFDVKKRKKTRIKKNNCQFEYRNSIFKKYLNNRFIILSVGFQLKKIWIPCLNHKDLLFLKEKQVTPYNIYQTVCKLRKEKLPNPKIIGNAGSFFKNPIICLNKAKYFLKSNPNIPYDFHSNNFIRLSAGWLIEKCGLRGYRINDAAVYKKQCLILINYGKATSYDVISLAIYIQKKVNDIFGILLYPEVRLIAAYGEINKLTMIT